MNSPAVCFNFEGTEQPTFSRTIKQNRIPACDIIGPSPDETILAGMDRALFYLGGQRIQKYLNWATPMMDSCPPNECETNIELHSSKSRICCCCNSKPKCFKDIPKICITKKPQSEPCKPETPCKSKCKNAGKSCCLKKCEEVQPRVLKRSFSLCSLACRKFRQKFTCSALKEQKPLWFWTRMRCCEDGSEVYEVFRNTNVCNHPSRIKVRSEPKIIFVVLPNGNIMPFETINIHK